MKINLIKLKSKKVLLILPVLVFIPTVVFAANVYEGLMGAVGISAGFQIFHGITGAPTLGDLIMNIIKFILGITGLVAILAIIIGGLRYIMSSGNEGMMTGAKNTILYAIIGLVIVILAYTIVSVIDNVILH